MSETKERQHTPQVVFITAIYGTYEASAKKYIPQSIDSDCICFTNNPNIIPNNWIIDTEPYHLIHSSPQDNGTYNNSLKNNQHTFNIAKYYKEQWHLIPRLSKYDYVVWLDGTIAITHHAFAEHIVAILCKGEKVITLDHDWRGGSLEAETLDSSTNGKYCVHWWNNQVQPYQDVIKQYNKYLENGYTDSYWKAKYPEKIHYGVFVTCIVAWPNNEETKNFLNMWYLQNLEFTTQDQIAFPYCCQKLNIWPYTFPDRESGGNQFHSLFFEKLNHGL